jgi:hypothetical protein
MLEKTEGAKKMDNLETPATPGTQDTGWRQTQHNIKRFKKIKRWATETCQKLSWTQAMTQLRTYFPSSENFTI